MIQAVERALKILETVARSPETPKPLRDLARATGLNLGTCSHIVKTLLETGYVEQKGRKQGYTLGPAAYRLGASGPYRRDLLQRAQPHMETLALERDVTVVLAVLRQGRRVTLGEARSQGLIQIRAEALREDDPYLTATGRVLLASLSPEELAAFTRSASLPGARWPDAARGPALRAALEQISRDGHAVLSKGEVAALACPIREGGRVVAALGAFLPSFRFVTPNREQLLAAVAQAARLSSQPEEGTPNERN